MSYLNTVRALIIAAFVLITGFATHAYVEREQAIASTVAGFQIVGCAADYDNEGCIIRTPDHELLFTNTWYRGEEQLSISVDAFLRAGKSEADIIRMLSDGAYNLQLDAMQYRDGFNIEVFATAGLLVGQEDFGPFYAVYGHPGVVLDNKF